MIQPSPNIKYLQHPHFTIHRQIEAGRRLVIIGESEKGDTYNPTLVFNKEMAIDIFGGGSLVGAYEDASTYQKELNVYLMRIDPNEYETAYSVLETFHFDLMFISETYFNKDMDVVKSFLEFSRIKEEKGNLIHGITTLSPGLTYDDLKDLSDLISSFTVDDGDELVETGKYLSFVVNQSTYQDAGAVYAGMISVLSPEVSPINKTIPNFEIELEFDKDEITSLRSIGIVCFRRTFKKGVTCASSSCAVSTEGSVHKHISNFRIAQSLINQISLELQPFIGQPHVVLKSNSIEEIIETICSEYERNQILRDYNYQIEINELYGTIDLLIELVPIFSIHRITTHSRVRIFR